MGFLCTQKLFFWRRNGARNEKCDEIKSLSWDCVEKSRVNQ